MWMCKHASERKTIRHTFVTYVIILQDKSSYPNEALFDSD